MKDVEPWLGINTKYSETWANITRKGIPPKDSEKYDGEENKFEKYFSEKSGNSDEK
jgi:ferredoxin